jgi:hypothetical protein
MDMYAGVHTTFYMDMLGCVVLAIHREAKEGIHMASHIDIYSAVYIANHMVMYVRV